MAIIDDMSKEELIEFVKETRSQLDTATDALWREVDRCKKELAEKMDTLYEQKKQQISLLYKAINTISHKITELTANFKVGDKVLVELRIDESNIQMTPSQVYEIGIGDGKYTIGHLYKLKRYKKNGEVSKVDIPMDKTDSTSWFGGIDEKLLHPYDKALDMKKYKKKKPKSKWTIRRVHV